MTHLSHLRGVVFTLHLHVLCKSFIFFTLIALMCCIPISLLRLFFPLFPYHIPVRPIRGFHLVARLYSDVYLYPWAFILLYFLVQNGS